MCFSNGRTPSAASASAARTTAYVVTSHDDDGRVTHAIRSDESMEHVLEELEGDAAEAAYGSRGSVVIDSPAEPGAD
jgi:hypothetical protein